MKYSVTLNGRYAYVLFCIDMYCDVSYWIKPKIHYTSFPVTSPQQVCNSRRGQKSVVGNMVAISTSTVKLWWNVSSGF